MNTVSGDGIPLPCVLHSHVVSRFS